MIRWQIVQQLEVFGADYVVLHLGLNKTTRSRFRATLDCADGDCHDKRPAKENPRRGEGQVSGSFLPFGSRSDRLLPHASSQPA